MFYKVQSTTLSSQTLDVVGVERIQFLEGPQKLAPGLLRLIAYHRLRGSGSTVVTMTSKVNGTMEISIPWRSETPENIETKIGHMITSWAPSTLPIFAEVGPMGSAPHIAEI